MAQQFQTAIRLPPELVKRLDKLAERMSKTGVPVTRAVVHRIALERGVAQLEKSGKR